MATKKFCDLCNWEIEKQEEVSIETYDFKRKPLTVACEVCRHCKEKLRLWLLEQTKRNA